MSSIGGVFWDIEDCKIPNDLSVVEVSQNIKKTISTVGIKDTEVSIRAYGDKKDHDFHSAGIPFTQSPAGERNARQKKDLSGRFVVGNRESSTSECFAYHGRPNKRVEVVELQISLINAGRSRTALRTNQNADSED